jgi:lysyl-tRNA synthetase class 2
VRVVGVRLLAAFAAIVGVVDLVAATPTPVGRACRTIAAFLMGQPLTRPQALILGLILITVAHGMAGRRRVAMHAALGGLALCLAAEVPAPPLRVAALGALMLVVVALRDQFATRPDQRRVRLAAEVGLAAVALVLVSGGWDIAVNRERPRVAGETLLAGLLADPMTHSAQGSLLAFLVTTGTVTVLLLAFAPAAPPGPAHPAARHAVTALAAHPDSGSLAPFATRSDMVYAFSPDHRAAVGYRVLYGVALAGGDPVGDAAAADAAIAAFLRECAAHGWRPAVLGAGADLLPLWRRHGLHGISIGDEAVLDVAGFKLASRRMRNVRQAVNRTYNAGVTVTLGPLTPELAAELRPVLDEWLAGHPERGFAMNLDHILVPRPDCLYAVAYRRDGRPEAFARFAVAGDGAILTLDVAPRRVGAPNGVVERLVVEVVGYAREQGAREVSLNFAGLRRFFETVGPLAGVAGAVGHAFDRWIDLGPLYRFCVKFQPTWRTRYLLLRSWLDVAFVAAAALSAEFGGGAGPVPEPVPEPVVIPAQQVPDAENASEATC